ncbi:organic cation transporter protein-like isoform X2 [Mizuhopecten yessoensis]|uniref:Organic cation transporter protein n=1 Tax=Mizuhopecten yessoensis TaxID=6573 RepID=A0A210Q7J5_MIZYE|nr:organic cation transporter protein-like isoform X2 [Mizuhopecten yessoensis]OWF44712.1 Organic cation transporter protein [Mizuhopecten yessoensis]
MSFDDVFKVLGEFGTYQKRVYLMQCVPQIFSAIQTCLSIFILFTPEHRCSIPLYDNDTFLVQSIRHQVMLNLSIPYEEDVDQYGRPTTQVSRCNVRRSIPWNNDTDGNSSFVTYQCHSFVFDTTIFQSTFTTEDNLVCQRKKYIVHATMSFMAGFTVGSLLLGIMADVVGRKKAMILSIVLYIIPNISGSFVTSFEQFVICRFLSGVSVGGLLGTGFVMGLEFVGPSKRMWAGIVIELFWASGTMLLALLAYLIRDWKYLNLVVSVPPVLFLSYIWIMPESVRWLLIKGRTDEAMEIIQHAARVNGVHVPSNILLKGKEEEKIEPEEPSSCFPVCKLFSTAKMAGRTSIIFLNWAVCSSVFYGLSINVGNISGNIFLNFFLISVAELLGFLSLLFVLNRFGRRPVYIFSVVSAGVFCVCTTFPVIFGSPEIQWVAVLLATIGKVGASASFATVLLFSAELFPTVIRNSAMGAASFCARVGGMVSPYIVDLAQSVDGDFGKALPMIIFGLCAILSGLLAYYLPETLHENLPETIADSMKKPRKSRPDITAIDVNTNQPLMNGYNAQENETTA